MYPFQRSFHEQPSASDKLSQHGYHRIYPWFLEHLRAQPVTMLEIGVNRTESLKLWGNYFPRLTLHGIDRDPKSFDDPRMTLHTVDQGDAAQLDRFVATIKTSFDFIIDDGSHVPEHQLLTLTKFWPLLRPGGIYIIEDIETSYWGRSEIYGYPFDARNPEHNLIAQAQSLISSVNSEFLTSPPPPSRLATLAPEVELLTFAYNSVILIKKDPASFGPFYGRPYRYSGRIHFPAPRLTWLQRLRRRLFT
jgi:hypothetical protein